MRKITCQCEQVFNVDMGDSVDLDADPSLVASIKEGSFLSFVCPTCGCVMHTDIRTRVDWPSKGISLVLVPELDRISFLSGTSPIDSGLVPVVGYPELADRVAVLDAGLDALAVESLKFHLLRRSSESNPGARVSVYFERLDDAGDLEFHAHGLSETEIAVVRVPRSVYERVLTDSRERPDAEPYALVQNGAYLSVQNVSFEDNANE